MPADASKPSSVRNRSDVGFASELPWAGIVSFSVQLVTFAGIHTEKEQPGSILDIESKKSLTERDLQVSRGS